MTKSKTWTEERVLASDLWMEKNIGPMPPEEEMESWRQTTRALDSLCGRGPTPWGALGRRRGGPRTGSRGLRAPSSARARRSA